MRLVTKGDSVIARNSCWNRVSRLRQLVIVGQYGTIEFIDPNTPVISMGDNCAPVVSRFATKDTVIRRTDQCNVVGQVTPVGQPANLGEVQFIENRFGPGEFGWVQLLGSVKTFVSKVVSDKRPISVMIIDGLRQNVHG